MNTTVYLIRHGENEFVKDSTGGQLVYGPEVSLSEEGRSQMGRLGEKFKNTNILFDELFTSTYPRAKESAQILSDELGGVNITEVNGLHDVFAPGWVGRPMDELKAVGGNIYDHLLTPDQETLEAFTQRVERVIYDLIELNGGKNIGIVSHGDFIRRAFSILAHSDEPLPTEIKRDEFYIDKGEAWRMVFDESLTLLEYERIDAETEKRDKERNY